MKKTLEEEVLHWVQLLCTIFCLCHSHQQEMYKDHNYVCFSDMRQEKADVIISWIELKDIGGSDSLCYNMCAHSESKNSFARQGLCIAPVIHKPPHTDTVATVSFYLFV